MRFANWPFLLLLILFPLLHRWWVRRNKPARVSYPLSVPKRLSSLNPIRILLIIKYIGLALVIAALARPQTSYRQTERTVSGIDIMLVQDLSASMYADDMGDRSRFEIAKATLEEFVRGRENDRIGFVAFSGEAITYAPPTLDYGLVLNAIHDANIGVLKDGTAIGDGLALAVTHLKDSKAKSRVVVLLTDGDNNMGQVDPATSGELAMGYGIRVYAILIGREGKVRLRIPHKGVLGQTVYTYQSMENTLNPELLQHIAKITDGRFFRVTEASTLDSVFKEINHLEKTEVKSNEKIRYDEIYQKPLKAGLLILAVEQILARGWWRLLP